MTMYVILRWYAVLYLTLISPCHLILYRPLINDDVIYHSNRQSAKLVVKIDAFERKLHHLYNWIIITVIGDIKLQIKKKHVQRNLKYYLSLDPIQGKHIY